MHNISKVKQKLTEKEIRILHQEKHDDVLEVTFSIQNLEDRLIITKEYMKEEMSIRISRYSDGVIKKLK